MVMVKADGEDECTGTIDELLSVTKPGTSSISTPSMYEPILYYHPFLSKIRLLNGLSTFVIILNITALTCLVTEAEPRPVR